MIAVRYACLSLLTLGTWASSYAADPPSAPPADNERIPALIRQLGDKSFRVREAASKELIELGSRAVPYLQANINEPDSEIAERCRRLLPIAARNDLERRIVAFLNDKADTMTPPLGGWKRFQVIVGNDASQRDLFAEIYRDNFSLLETYERNPKAVQADLAKRCNELFQRVYGGQRFGGGQPNTVRFEEVAAIVFMAGDPEITLDVQSMNYLTNLFYQQGPQQGFRKPGSGRKLLERFLARQSSDLVTLNNTYHLALNLGMNDFIQSTLKPNASKAIRDAAGRGRRSDPNALSQALWVAQALDLREGLDLALMLIDDKYDYPVFMAVASTAIVTTLKPNQQPQINAWTRGQGMILISKFGNKSHIPTLEALFGDKTNIGGFGVNNVRGDTQLRDAALCVSVYLSGQNLTDYGFAYFEAVQGVKPHQTSVGCLGFSDNEKREAAFKKWREWRSKNDPTRN